MAFENPRTERDLVYVIVRPRHAGVLCLAPAVLGPASIEANLGDLGRIDVDFVSSGRVRAERSVCGGEAVRVDVGRYEGSIDFRGEEGYSEVHAGSARGEVRESLNLVCPGRSWSEGTGGDAPGARLTVRDRGAHGLEFTARKNSPTRPAMFAVSTSERRGSLFVARGIEVRAGPGAFEFDVPAGKAHIEPPTPFAGEASYRRIEGKGVVWKGNLSVDLPGRPDVRLTGRSTRASLIRAVLNPGQVFKGS